MSPDNIGYFNHAITRIFTGFLPAISFHAGKSC